MPTFTNVFKTAIPMYQKVTKIKGGQDIVDVPQFKSYQEFRDKSIDYMLDIDNFLRPSKCWLEESTRKDFHKFLKRRNKEYTKQGREVAKKFVEYRQNQLVTLISEPAGQYDVVGQSFDIGRILSGEPECMVNHYQNIESRSRYLDIIIPVSAPRWIVDHNSTFVNRQLFKYFSPILDMIDQWEQNGTRCRIIADFSTIPAEHKKNDVFINGSFVVKEFDEIIDFELFSTIFMTSAMSNLTFCHLYMNNRITIGDGSFSRTPDYDAFGKVCNYNPGEPNTIRIPSTFYLEQMRFDYLTGIELLEAFGYPVQQL